MRLFVAVNFSDQIKKELSAAVEKLRLCARKGNFSREENFHITLAFIGETENAAAVKRAIDKTEAESFFLTVGSMGKFERRGGDIYWVGVERSAALQRLHAGLLANLRREGFLLEKTDYRPHITLGRGVALEKALDFTVPGMRVAVDRISLMKSERLNGKLTYTPIYGKQI